MATKPQQPGGGKKEPESKSAKRTAELLAEDCKRICTTNLIKPFATLQDAIDHLLPFHVLSSIAGDEADAEEAEAAAEEGARMVCSRRELAQEMVTRRAVELHAKVDDMRTRLVKLEERYRARQQKPLPEEELFIAQVLKEVAERSLEAERAKPPAMGSDSESDSEEGEDPTPGAARRA